MNDEQDLQTPTETLSGLTVDDPHHQGLMADFLKFFMNDMYVRKRFLMVGFLVTLSDRTGHATSKISQYI